MVHILRRIKLIFSSTKFYVLVKKIKYILYVRSNYTSNDYIQTTIKNNNTVIRLLLKKKVTETIHVTRYLTSVLLFLKNWNEEVSHFYSLENYMITKIVNLTREKLYIFIYLFIYFHISVLNKGKLLYDYYSCLSLLFSSSCKLSMGVSDVPMFRCFIYKQ